MNKEKEYFTDLYNQDFEYVYSYVYSRTAGNSQLTEDIVQDTFAAAWLSLGRFDRRSTSRTWFCSIAKNKLCEHYRRTIYREKIELSTEEELADYPDSADIEEAVIGNEMRECLLEIMKKMNPTYSYVLIMKYMDGYSVKEIAKVIGRSAKAVDGIIQRAKVSFKREYTKLEGCDGKNE
ncbi:MAG: RNA polymerase sigma factor [Eubacteriales bacterium]